MQLLLADLKIVASLILISLLILLLDNFKLLDIPKSGVQFVTLPIQYGFYKTSRVVENQFEIVTLARRASQENKAMQEQLGQLLSENSNLRKKLSETETLVKQQQAINPQTFNLVAAHPIGILRYLYIDKGSDDRLAVDQVVIFQDTYLGRIVETSPRRSKVMLSSDPDSKVSAFVASNNGRAKGVLSGQFGSEVVLDKVLHQEPLNVDDLVYSEGTELAIPKGLILGKIEQVLDRDNEVFKQAKVKQMFNAADLDLVFVVTE